MQLSGGSTSLFATARNIYKNEGPRSFYLSYPVTLIMSIPFQAIQFTTYEFGRKKLNPSGEYNPLSHCAAGGLAGAAASLATNPLDVAKTMLQTRGLATDNAIRHVSGLRTAFSAIYSRYGVAGFSRVRFLLLS
jgi:solute carrier family 25 iron transporter 28/37